MRFVATFALAVAAMGAIVGTAATASVKDGVDAWQRGDYATAVAQWKPAAEAGDADAQFNLAQAYKLGRGVPTDLGQAQSWYQKAAQQGHEQAQANLGLILFQNGDRAAAMPWIQKAADHGEPRAQYVLGTAMFNGELVTKDWVKAYALMTRAAAAGLPQATTSLTQMDTYIPADQRRQGLALAAEMAKSQPSSSMADAQPRSPSPTPPPPPRPAIRTTDLPPSAPAAAASPPPPPAAAPARAIPSQAQGSAPMAGEGGWRIQLGAFSSAATARTLWTRVSGRLPGARSYVVEAGPITRLQAGPYPNRAAAARACSELVGQPCFPVAAP
ncbi:SPOR domain-containing protein [Flavisphingomonas formosensis]|uniref:SPOR domain-containing protein n=1 Tax=Flavisphingomonas formosensis TaxID=861534 RepID=UPI0012FA2F00|nr:SPOR domain-containing protein [Sphingomonas formosensis]